MVLCHILHSMFVHGLATILKNVDTVNINGPSNSSSVIFLPGEKGGGFHKSNLSLESVGEVNSTDSDQHITLDYAEISH